ncbi:MAG: hypothetical protein AAGF49_08850 [Pseudomonadota bacterium]
MTRGERLRRAVDRLNHVPMTWGQDDCSMFPALWAAAITGRSAQWPRYSTEAEAHALIFEAGGLVPLWRRLADEMGLRERERGEPPLVGDVGVISTRRMGEAGGVFAEHGVLCWRAETGVRLLAPRWQTVLAIWEVPECPLR